MNTQPIEKLDLQDDGSLDVVSIFKTIQGEGPFVGRPAVFVRLAGCNLQCPLCDTDYTSKRKRMSIPTLLDAIRDANGDNWFPNLVVITGGEPFRQDIRFLARCLFNEGVAVQVETNGTVLPNTEKHGTAWLQHITIVCAPKTPKIHEGFNYVVCYWKYVVRAGEIDPDDGLPTTVLGMSQFPARPTPGTSKDSVFIQPADEGNPEKNKANVQAAVEICLKYGYRLSLQTHKIVGLD